MRGIKRVGPYGPRCSTRPKDRFAEMLAHDYIPQWIPKVLLDELRERVLRSVTEPGPFRRREL